MDLPEATQRRTLPQFFIILLTFALIYLVSWPVVFSFDLWVLKDRSSFLNLDYLLDQHLRLGVDTYYIYGLLPVLLQHWLFALFGRGYWPLLPCAAVALVLIAFYCACLLRYLPQEAIWLVAILATSRLMNWVNPNLPYTLVQLSLLFAVLFVLASRLDLALAASAVGCWSVPSLPLVLLAMLVVFIVIEWLGKPQRTLAGLVRALAPGAAVYLGLGALLAWRFGWQSLIATATPLAGMRYYQQAHAGRFSGLMDFLHPPGHSLFYIVATPVAWWVFSSAALFVFGLLAFGRIVSRRALNPKDTAIVLCAALHAVLVLVAYGASHQHIIFDPILITGCLLGFSTLSRRGFRTTLLAVFMVLGLAGEVVFVRDTLSAWKDVRSPQTTANLYAQRDWVAEWTKILDLASRHNLLLLSYSTGVHHYFPAVHSPDQWFMLIGQETLADKVRLMAKLRNADIVAEDRSSLTSFIENDPDIQSYLGSLCFTQSSKYFKVWWKPVPDSAHPSCIVRSGSSPAAAPDAAR